MDPGTTALETPPPGSTIGIVHPGAMGAALARCFVRRGHRVVWASQSRSERTRQRAAEAGLHDVGDLDAVVAQSDLVVSVVPPQAAAQVVHEVGGRARVFVEANAISPEHSLQLRAVVEGAGGTFVDASVVGPPPDDERRARLFLAGPGAGTVAEKLGGGPVEAVELEGLAAASALKMCYASWTKGAQALVLASLASARAHGVEGDLLAEWSRSLPDLAPQAERAALAAARKGWRWSHEMNEIAATHRAVGLPGGFHDAAEWIFHQAPRDEEAERGDATLAAVLEQLITPLDPGSGPADGGEA